jgi:hypothetical protein
MMSTRRAVLLCLSGLTGLALLAASSFAQAAEGVAYTFTSGTGDASGKITITNASNGSTASVGLIPKLSAAACASMLYAAAPKVGFKADLHGATVTITGRGVVVKVEGVTVEKSEISP